MSENLTDRGPAIVQPSIGLLKFEFNMKVFSVVNFNHKCFMINKEHILGNFPLT